MKHLVVRADTKLMAKFPVGDKGGLAISFTPVSQKENFFLVSFGNGTPFLWRASYMTLSIEESENGEVSTS